MARPYDVIPLDCYGTLIDRIPSAFSGHRPAWELAK
jgi:hypothetical protein